MERKLTNGVPHSVYRSLATAVAPEPVGEGDAVQAAHRLHAALGVKQRAHYGRGAQGQGVGQLVHRGQLRRGEEGLEPVEGCANLGRPDVEAEVQIPHVTTRVDELVGVLLDQQVLQHPALGHQAGVDWSWGEGEGSSGVRGTGSTTWGLTH